MATDPFEGPDERQDPPESERSGQEDFEAMFDSVLNEVLQGRREASDKIRVALDLRTDILTDASAAPRLSKRHNAHIRTEKIADLMCQAAFGQGEKRLKAIEALKGEVKRAEEEGIFVFPYSDELETDRLEAAYPDGQREYLIVEASGSHPRIDHPRHGKPGPAADAQIHLPSSDSSASPVFARPDPARDAILSPELLESMLLRPHAVAQVDDIVSDPDMGKLSLASAALERGLQIIVEDVNPGRDPSGRIEFITAEIVSIRGMELHAGETLYFDHEIPASPILNRRSMVVFDHFKSSYATNFDTAWVLQGHRIPIEGHPLVRHLIANWYVKVARTKKPS